jgi:C4-dicarboxylate-specific signal transduction histidine kinase
LRIFLRYCQRNERFARVRERSEQAQGRAAEAEEKTVIKTNEGNGKLNLDRSMATQALASAFSWLRRMTAHDSRFTEAFTPLQSGDVNGSIGEGEARLLEVAPAAAESELRRLRRQRTSEVGDMAAALAHEVDQPLTAILSNAQAAQRFLAQTPPAVGDLQELLAEVVADSTRAHAIIRKMRQSARCELPETSVIDAGSLVHDAVRLLRRETQALGAAIVARIEDHLPPLRGDAVHLQQVLVNLLLNALDAVHDSDVEDRRISVIVTATAHRDKVCIAIRDRGCGVDAGQFATLFKPFVTSKPEGLGLGLSISRTIVMAHGGQLRAERNPDRGMTFHIELPVQGESVSAPV